MIQHRGYQISLTKEYDRWEYDDHAITTNFFVRGGGQPFWRASSALGVCYAVEQLEALRGARRLIDQRIG